MYNDCFVSKLLNLFISEIDFTAVIVRYDNFAQCVEMLYKSKRQNSVKNAYCQHQIPVL